MEKIEEVRLVDILDKVILEARQNGYNRAFEIRQKAFREICQLFEPKPDESRLLTDEEITSAAIQGNAELPSYGSTSAEHWHAEYRAIAKTQDAKTASIKDAEYGSKIETYQKANKDFQDLLIEAHRQEQARVERMFKEIDTYLIEELKNHGWQDFLEFLQVLKKQERIE